ncbi:PAS domain-containing sensor histidine kinase [Nocardioides sp. KIGAM211]|uniref:PAS domain-containing sensor histidine kinase n=1 Tax=Nocardioides luti TaxID=2761101 RepID=A0A7X0RIC5_9ACTN|nr:PAS domain-containing sensor histidine kinase [Nocardioides luti]MBB6628660.1 PAS domain-containing sensor histidine kinase [Nocardioides luti]
MVSASRGAVPDDLALDLGRQDDADGVARLLEQVGATVLDATVRVVPDPAGEADEAASGAGDLRLDLTWKGRSHGTLVVTRADGAAPLDDEDRALAARIAEHGALALDCAVAHDEHEAAWDELTRFRALAAASTNLVALADDDGVPSFVNPRVAEVGLEIGERGLWGTVAGNVAPEDVEEMRRILLDEGRWSGDIALVGSDPPTIVHGTVFVLRHPTTGASLGTGWVAEDVTALRRAEQMLRSANANLERYQALVEASSDFIAIAALDGSVIYVNPAGREQIGMPADVDVTRTTIVDYLTPEGIEASLQIEQPAVQAEGHWEGESTLRRFDGGPAIPVAIASFLMLHPETGAPFALATVQRDISDRMAQEDALRRLADQRQELLNRLVRAQSEERAEIANDVHDDPVQALAAVDLRLGLLARKLGDQAPQLLPDLVPVQESVTGATRRLRALVFNLQPPDFDDGLGVALDNAARDLFETSGTTWRVDADDEPVAPDSIRAVAYRVAREAMVNARKHAAARSLVVTVRGRDGGLEVSVADDGVGLPDGAVTSSPGHHGLGSMRDRAEIAGGHWDMRGRPGGGVEVVCWLPLAAPSGLEPGPGPR